MTLLACACPAPATQVVPGPELPAKPLPPDLRQRADRGLQAVQRGDFAAGRKLLLEVLEHAGGEERVAVLAALAEAEHRLGQEHEAARHATELYRLTDRPAERAFALQLLGGAIPPAEASRELPAVGVLVPALGGYRLAGREFLAGALAGANAPVATRLRVLIEDASTDPAGAARALLERGALALLGAPCRSEDARAVAPIAKQAGVPFFSAACGDAISDAVLCLLPSAQSRAHALAQHALRAGLRRFALLAPRSAYGRVMGALFGAELLRSGASLAVELSYAEGTRSFTAEVKRLASHSFEALFVPDSAQQLALLAPALAEEHAGRTAGTRRRPPLLLATADGLTPGRLSLVSRYLQGAVLAPGFAVDGVPAAERPRLATLERTLGGPPSLLQAFAADIIAALQASLASGAHGTNGLREALERIGRTGLTGPLSFAADGTRASPPLLYRVENSQLRQL